LESECADVWKIAGGRAMLDPSATLPDLGVRRNREEDEDMQILQHDLDHEFPEYLNLIHELKDKDQSIAGLCEAYERVNQQIVDIEENDKVFQDFEFEDLKKKRLRLKDDIYLALLAHKR
jgi:uncharacterized protein YdcH (DUF465 family)